MDDIILMLSKSAEWDKDKFLSDFTNSCYWKPLMLEEVDPKDYLETTLKVEGGVVHTRLKNKNEFKNEVWRYHHFRSQADYMVKRATLLNALRKVDSHASGSIQLRLSAMSKIKEFMRLGYPRGILRYMCQQLCLETKRIEWIQIRKLIFPN